MASAAILAVAQAASAQDRPVTFNVGAGPIIPTGDVADRFDTGVTVPFGVTFNIGENVGIQGEYSYSWMNGPDATITPIGGDPTLLESNHSMHMGNANVVFKPTTSGPVGGYALGGIGVYRREVELTTPAVGLVTVCDPFWYVCFPTAVPVDQVVGSRSTTDFGINFGGGVTFARRFYVEVRYHYIWGPEFERPEALGGGTVNANGHYVPIIFGVRF
jgi:opacity protein-like surface antigen